MLPFFPLAGLQHDHASGEQHGELCRERSDHMSYREFRGWGWGVSDRDKRPGMASRV